MAPNSNFRFASKRRLLSCNMMSMTTKNGGFPEFFHSFLNISSISERICTILMSHTPFYLTSNKFKQHFLNIERSWTWSCIDLEHSIFGFQQIDIEHQHWRWTSNLMGTMSSASKKSNLSEWDQTWSTSSVLNADWCLIIKKFQLLTINEIWAK